MDFRMLFDACVYHSKHKCQKQSKICEREHSTEWTEEFMGIVLI